MPAVTEEVLALLTQTERDPTEAREAEEEEDYADDVGCLAEEYLYICHVFLVARWALSKVRLKFGCDFWTFFDADQALIVLPAFPHGFYRAFLLILLLYTA